MEKDKLSEEELKAKLQKLSESETSESEDLDIFAWSAQCYVPARPPIEEVKCDSCGKIMSSYFNGFSRIKDYVESIKALGYDTKVEFVCGTCSAKMVFKTESMYLASLNRESGFKNEIRDIDSFIPILSFGTDSFDSPSPESYRIHILFYFKAEGQEQYRITECSDEKDYKIVLDYLSRKAQLDSAQDEASPSSQKEKISLSEEEAGVIRELTGLTI